MLAHLTYSHRLSIGLDPSLLRSMCNDNAGKGLDGECEPFVESGFQGTGSHPIGTPFTARG